MLLETRYSMTQANLSCWSWSRQSTRDSNKSTNTFILLKALHLISRPRLQPWRSVQSKLN